MLCSHWCTSAITSSLILLLLSLIWERQRKLLLCTNYLSWKRLRLPIFGLILSLVNNLVSHVFMPDLRIIIICKLFIFHILFITYLLLVVILCTLCNSYHVSIVLFTAHTVSFKSCMYLTCYFVCVKSSVCIFSLCSTVSLTTLLNIWAWLIDNLLYVCFNREFYVPWLVHNIYEYDNNLLCRWRTGK